MSNQFEHHDHVRPMMPDDKLRERYKKTVEIDSETLLNNFEDMVRKGAGDQVLEVVWMRNEILRRMLSLIKSRLDNVREQANRRGCESC